MHDQIAFLKRAVQRGDTMGVLNCYVIRSGQVTARDSSLQAGLPFPALISDDFNVPASELEAILGRLKSDVEMSHSDGIVTVRGKRVKAEIRCVDDEPPMMTMPGGGWKPVPPGLREAFATVIPFITDKESNFGVRIMNDRVTVIGNRAGIDVTVAGLSATESCLSLQCVEFVMSQSDSPSEYHQTEGAVAFRWPGDRWVRSQTLTKPFPSTVDRVLASAGNETPVEITDEWREAWDDASSLGDDVIEMRPTMLVAVRATSRVEVTCETQGVPDESFWSTISLNPVIKVATHWNPASWPKPAAFKGPNFRGIVTTVSGRV